MSRSPAVFVLVGVLLLLFTIWTLSALPTLDGLNASHRRAARMAVAAMPEEDLRRVFEPPPQEANMEEWLRAYFGDGFSSYLSPIVVSQILVSGGLGALCCVLGVYQGILVRRAKS